MRRILYYSLLCLLWISVNSCKEDEVSQPPTPTLSVNRSSGLYQSTEFEFTIEQVSSTSVSLLPYGTEQPNTAGVLVPASSFQNGKAVVKFVYGQVGTFNAVVVANNHSGSGESVKNAISSPVTVTVTSDKTLITEFSLAGKVNVRGDMFDATSSLVDLTSIKPDLAPDKIVYDTTSNPRTIKITVPYGTDVTKLKAKFTTSDFATVKVGGTAQTSEGNENDFSSPVTYSVTSLNGEKTTDYVVTVVETPIETKHRFSSLAGIIAEGNKARDGRVLPASVDTVNHVIVFYDTLHASPASEFDVANYKAVQLDFGLTGDFAYVRLDDNNHVGSGDTLDISEPFNLTLVPQDSLGTVDIDYPGTGDEVTDEGKQTYTVSVSEAPKLLLSFDDLNPSPQGSSDADFNVALNVLTGTNVEAINSYYSFVMPAGMTLVGIRANGAVVNDGDPVDYKKPATIAATVTNADGVTFTVRYTVTVTVK